MALTEQLQSLTANEGGVKYLDDKGKEYTLDQATKKGVFVKPVFMDNKKEILETLFGKQRISVDDVKLIHQLINKAVELSVSSTFKNKLKKEGLL